MSRETDEARDLRKTRHIDTPLGAKVRQARDAHPVSREDMASFLGVSVATIQRYENGKQRIPAARLWQICRRLNLDLTALFGELPHHVAGENGVAEPPVAFDHEDHRAAHLSALSKAAGRLSTDRLEIAVDLLRALKVTSRSS